MKKSSIVGFILFISICLIVTGCSSANSEKTADKNAADKITEADIFKDGKDKPADHVYEKKDGDKKVTVAKKDGEDPKAVVKVEKDKKDNKKDENEKKVTKPVAASKTTTSTAATTQKSESKPVAAKPASNSAPAEKPEPKPQPAPKPAPAPSVALVPEAQAKDMLRGSGLFRDNGNIFVHASTVEGIVPGAAFDVRFQGSGHVSLLHLDGIRYTALLPDASQYQQDINLTQSAVKRGTDAVFGSGTAASQQLYNIMIQKADQPNFASFTTNIGGHNLSISWQGGVAVFIQ